MARIKMTITINSNFDVSTTFRGSSAELQKCNRALAKHIREQERTTRILASATTYVDERPADERLTTKGAAHA